MASRRSDCRQLSRGSIRHATIARIGDEKRLADVLDADARPRWGVLIRCDLTLDPTRL
jgi:hypothetical protein